MAKSKRKYPKKKNNTNYQKKSSDGYDKSQNVTIKQNKDVYNDDYKEYKSYQETQKPLLLRLFIIALACVIFLGFVIFPLVQQ